METALLKISNNYVTKCSDCLSGFILPALFATLDVVDHSLLEYSTLSGSSIHPPFHPHLTIHAFPSLLQEFSFLCPLRCWFPQSSVLGSPLALLVLLWSHVLTQFSYQPVLWWPWCCPRQPLILGDSFSRSSLQHLFLNVLSTPQLSYPRALIFPSALLLFLWFLTDGTTQSLQLEPGNHLYPRICFIHASNTYVFIHLDCHKQILLTG